MSKSNKQVDGLSEDMIVVGPGQMLKDARKELSLSVEDVADKLKFKPCLVNNIEQDIFDQKLPATFNRGYLCSYAKIVKVDINEVLSAYDMLGVAELQRSEMQSFSNLTEKQAEHSRLMWFSYLIVAILFGLMVLWWLQAPNNEKPLQEQSSIANDSAINEKSTAESAGILIDKKNNALVNSQPEQSQVEKIPAKLQTNIETKEAETIKLNAIEAVEIKSNTVEHNQVLFNEISTAVFTFSGDCWVNIYDATGERIAWGVKKSGYVMTISGKPPFKVTLGKPELASIVLNGQLIDMSTLDVGNIAKFSLPLNL